jgi:tetratricopeptide (TPR) repeat protein
MKDNTHEETPLIMPGKKKNIIFPILFAFGIPVLLYIQTRHFEFTHFDDTQIISNNIAFLRDLRNIPQAFLKGAFVLERSSFYRPLQTVSYMLDIKISGGNNPRMYHLSNIVLLSLIAYILFILLKRFSIPPKLALLTTLIFCAHPLFVSSVAWIPARGDLLLAFFSLLSFLFLVELLQKKKKIYLFLHWITFTFALFSKETAIFLPFLFILYYFIFSFKERFEKIILFNIILYTVSGAVWYWLRSKTIGDFTYQNGVFGLEAILLNLRNIPESLAKFFLPADIAPIPGYSLFNTLAGIGIMIAIVILFFNSKGERSKKEKLFCFAWFLFLLLPTMLFKHKRIEYLDHRFFLPLIGIVLFVLFIIPKKWFENGDIKKPWLMVLVLILLSFYTFNKTKAYSDPMTFYNSAITHNKNSAFAYNNRGFIKMRRGDNSGAIADYDRAIAISPTYYNAFSDRGWVKSTLHDYSGAIADLNKAISLNNKHDVSYYRRGIVNLNSGNIKNAIEDFNSLISIDPNNAQGYNYRGLALLRSGNFQEAIINFNKAIEIDPKYAEAYGYRAIAKYSLKDLTGAIEDCERVLKLHPRDVKMLRIKTKIQQELLELNH